MFNPWKILGWKICTVFAILMLGNFVLYLTGVYGETDVPKDVLLTPTAISYTPIGEQIFNRILYGLIIIYTMTYVIVRQIKYNRDKNERSGESPNYFRIWGLGETGKMISINDDLRHFQEILSCTNCVYFNQQADGKDIPWCIAPNSPNIENNHCLTFKER